jgi:hypothetical protein
MGAAAVKTDRIRLGRRLGEEVRFATDSPLEESGFEPLVPLTPKRLNGSMPVSAMRK